MHACDCCTPRVKKVLFDLDSDLGSGFTAMEKESGAQFAVEDEDVENKPVEYFCGFGSCRPKCLQVFRNAKFFTFLLCCYTFLEGSLATGMFLAVS